MSISDIIITAVIAALAVSAIIYIIIRKRKGKGCGCNCEGCAYRCDKYKESKGRST